MSEPKVEKQLRGVANARIAELEDMLRRNEANETRLGQEITRLRDALERIGAEGSGRVDWSSLVRAIRHEARAALEPRHA